MERVGSQRRDKVGGGRCDQSFSTEKKELVGVVEDEVGEVSGGAALQHELQDGECGVVVVL